MSNITNLNRDYLIKINVKEATIDVPKMTFWNTDKKTSNMFVQLVINMSENELIKNYVTIENATDYKITLNVIKPKTNQYRTFEAKLLNEEKALFEIDLTSEFIDQVGNYNFEFEVSSKVDNNDESITTSSSTYEVKGSILTNLNEEISSSPDLPILKQLIEQVKSLQGGDLTGYQKKSDNSLETTSKEVVGAINEVNSQFKDIENLSLTKHTDGKVYIKKQDGTLLGTGIEIGGSDVDLSKITMSMSGQTLKLMNGGTQVATVEIPTAVVTDEQLTSIIQSKIDDGTLTNMTIADNSITPQKTDFFKVMDSTNPVIETTWGDGGYNAVKTDYVDAIDELYVIINSASGSGNEVKIDYYNSSKTLISTYTPDNDFYTKYRETIFTSPTGGSSVDYAFARIVTIKLPIKELKPEGTVYIRITASYVKTGDSCELRKTLDTENGKYISLDAKYNNDLIKNIDISNINFKTISNNSLLNYKKVTTGSTDFGTNNMYFTDYIDTSVNKEIYIRFALQSPIQIINISDIAYYNENKQYIKTAYANPGSDANKEQANFTIVYNDMSQDANKELENGEKVNTITIVKLTVPDEAKYIRLGNLNLTLRQFAKLWSFLYVSYEPITDTYRMTDTYNVVINTDFKELVNDCIEKPKHTMCCIGDSLTNWGGGSDYADGFLKVVHDKTGVMTFNKGLAGAWWQTGTGQTQCAVNRVDSIITNKEKFDLYCFIMGTNAGSTTDTGETSSDKTTMCGAIRYCMETLKAYDPTGQILVCLPPQRAEGNDGQLLVNEVIKKIVEDEYSIRTLDLYRHSGVVPNTTIADINYLSDGLHLGERGQMAIGNTLACEVKYMLCL